MTSDDTTTDSIEAGDCLESIDECVTTSSPDVIAAIIIILVLFSAFVAAHAVVITVCIIKRKSSRNKLSDAVRYQNRPTEVVANVLYIGPYKVEAFIKYW